jgi:hypothetical protein
MRRLVFAVILVGVVVYPTHAPAQQNPRDVRQWLQLFNGRDLTDWTAKFAKHDLGENFRNTFRVEEGLLKVRYDQWPRSTASSATCSTKTRFPTICWRLSIASSASRSPAPRAGRSATTA